MISLGLYFLVGSHIEKESIGSFLPAARERLGVLRGGFHHAEHDIVILASFYHSSSFVDHDEFSRFTSSLIDRSDGGVHYLWAEASGESTSRSDESRRSPGGESEDGNGSGYVVRYVAPEIGNESVIGTDLGARPESLARLEELRDSGKSGIVEWNLVEKEGADRYLFTVCSPVYSGGEAKHSTGERRVSLGGFVCGRHDLAALVGSVVDPLDPEGVDFILRRQSPTMADGVVFVHRSHLAGAGSPDRWFQDPRSVEFEEKFEVFDEEWSFLARRNPNSLSGQWQKWAVLFSSLCLMIVFHLFFIARRNEKDKKDRYITYQDVINDIYRISFAQRSLEERLEKALKTLLRIPWIFNQSKGAIFLADEGSRSLRLVAHQSLDPALLELCRTVPYGHCLCGQAALARELCFAAEVDDRHHIRFETMKPHGHYSLPMTSGDELLGVLTLYLDAGHLENEEEKSLLLGIANTLSAMVKRHLNDENIKKINEDLENTVSRRTDELKQSLVALKRIQQSLIQSETMAALGGLVAGVAHEINTPVGNAYTAATFLEEERRKIAQSFHQGQMRRSELAGFLDSLEELSRVFVSNLGRAAELVRSFKLVVVDQSSHEWRSIRVKAYVDDILISMRPKIKKSGHVIVRDCPDELEIFSHPGALSQILVNLIDNSFTHGFDDGKEGHIGIRIREESGHIHILYEDDGKGMTEDVARRIFEPFFTTSRGAGGSGLGMHIVFNRVVQTLGGEIRCGSTPGHGATFEIRFPIREKGSEV
ncbi:MAG: CHASE domain-containing protein [Magnetococcales bacterium]|nr:CHASE domain-containing protein [Magnetococcales bacterium]